MVVVLSFSGLISYNGPYYVWCGRSRSTSSDSHRAIHRNCYVVGQTRKTNKERPFTRTRLLLYPVDIYHLLCCLYFNSCKRQIALYVSLSPTSACPLQYYLLPVNAPPPVTHRSACHKWVSFPWHGSHVVVKNVSLDLSLRNQLAFSGVSLIIVRGRGPFSFFPHVTHIASMYTLPLALQSDVTKL